jgi:hypothetical protein
MTQSLYHQDLPGLARPAALGASDLNHREGQSAAQERELCVLRYAHEPHAGCSGRGMNHYLTFRGSEPVRDLYDRWMRAWHAGEATFRAA